MAGEEVPTVCGLLFDRALLQYEENVRFGSAQSIPSTNSAKSLAYGLIDKYLGRQSVWVGVYERELQIAMDFSTDGFRAKDAIQRMSGRHMTEEPFLYPALYSSVMRMKDRNEKRRVLILFLDLLDSETIARLKPLKNLLSSSNIEVFIVTFASRLGSGGPGLNPVMSQSGLKELAQATAGDAFFAADYKDHLDDISKHIYNQLRTFYTFGFESTSPPNAPTKLTIRCTRPGSKVKCRPNVPMLQ